MHRVIARLTRRARVARIRFWARARLRRNDAVILDTETTDLDGDVIQLSVIDLRGTVLLSTLVRPTSPISDTAILVHGITDTDVADAPSMREVAHQLHAVIGDKWLLAYNAPFDREALLRGLDLAQIAPGRLAGSKHWRCLMRLRAATEDGRWTKLGGPHHALGDCIAALQVLAQLAGQSDADRGRQPQGHYLGRTLPT